MNGEVFRLTFEDSKSDWNQFAHMETDKEIEIEGVLYKKGVMLPYEPGRSVRIICYTREGMLWVWNAWEYTGPQGESRLESHENFAGMIIEEILNGFRYRCNEGRDDDDYDDLIFRIERTVEIQPTRGRPVPNSGRG